MTDLPNWTDLTGPERDAIIRPLWAAGKSAGQIQHYFIGATRNAIIGYIHRAKLPKRLMPTNQHSKKKPKPRSDKPKSRPAPKPKPMAYTAPFTQIPDLEPPPQSVLDMINSDRAPLAGTVPIDILALPNRPGVRCRFPVTGGYCGAPSGDHTYCPTHHAIAYRPAERMRMPKEARR